MLFSLNLIITKKSELSMDLLLIEKNGDLRNKLLVVFFRPAHQKIGIT